MNTERDIEMRTALRGHAGAMLVLLVYATAQIGYLVVFVQRNVRPAQGMPLVTSYAPPFPDPSLAWTPRLRSPSPAPSTQGSP